MCYKTVTAGRGSITDEVRGSGTVEAKLATSVSFREMEGRLKEMYFTRGQDVEEGDLLAELLNDEFLEALNRQEIYHRIAEIEYEKSRRGYLSRLDREMVQLYMDLSNLDLEQARATVERTRLYAPISGRIIYSATIRADDMISSFTPIFSIAVLSEFVLRVSDDLASSVPVGAKVSVTLNNETHTGTVVQSPSLNPVDAIDRYDAVIECPTIIIKESNLGNRFQVTYVRDHAEDVIVIERSLIRTHSGRTFVIVLVDGVPMERNVVIGIKNNSYAEIIEGLQEGDLIIQ